MIDFAIPAGELLAHMFDDFPAARIALQRLRHFLAELAQPDAAALGAGAWRGLDDALDGQIVRQLAWSARCAGASVLARAGRGVLGLGLFLGLRLFEIFDRKFELLDEQLATFRGLTEHLATRLGEHQLQPLDLQGADFRFARRHDQHLALREDHRMRAGEVAREIFEARRHAAK